MRLTSSEHFQNDRHHILQVGNLIIYSSRREDSGNYSCAPSNLDSASVVLHVLSGQSTSTIHYSIHRNTSDYVRLILKYNLRLYFTTLYVWYFCKKYKKYLKCIAYFTEG